MILIILISFIVALLFWILLGPVIIHADTEGNRYFLTLPAVFRAELVPDKELFGVRVWIFFIPFRINPFKQSRGKKVEKKVKPKKKRKKRMGIKSMIQLMREMIGSFRIRKLNLDLDTDDFILNSYLVPVFSGINYRNSDRENINMQVNYEGRMSVLLNVRFSMGHLLWIFFKHNFNSKLNR